MYRYLDSLPQRHQQLLTNYRQHLEDVCKAIDTNHKVIELISMKPQEPLDTDKVNSVFKQLVREWTDVGVNERKTCFEPILNSIEEHFGDCGDRSGVQVLVPGAGLGRLPYEIAKRGFACQGNEYSLFMLFTSNFLLNKCKQRLVHTFYPWAQHFTNNMRSADQLTAVRFPDANPSDLPANCDFSMAAGNFI
ncbi:unnamed protein product, partial [Medioppia subpectinata]